MSTYSSTGELFARRFKNLDPAWVEMVNDKVELLKVESSGNGESHTVWRGGRDLETQWSFKPPKRPRYHKPIQS